MIVLSLPEIADVHSLLYALLEVVFPTNFDSFSTGTAIYITRAPCIGVGGRPKKIKLSRLVGSFAKKEKAKTRRTQDRTNGYFTDGSHADKKHGILVRPHNHLPSSHSRHWLQYTMNITCNAWPVYKFFNILLYSILIFYVCTVIVYCILIF